MRIKNYFNQSFIYSGLVFCFLWCGCNIFNPHEHEARRILNEAGLRGGLIVHLACGDGKLTTALHANESFLVQGLDTDAKNVKNAREYIQSRDLNGKVSVELLGQNHLPYIDNLVNLLIAEDLGKISINEVMRVLVPNGKAYIKNGDSWIEKTKPRPKNIDDWTHYLYDASNNAVSRDSVVGPPRRYQWLGGPRWSRSHEHMSSVNALVSSGGKIFYVMDEGSRASINLPTKWSLIARDAFNGVILWKRSLPSWHTHRWPLKSGPAQLPRRLVTSGDKVYLPLGIDAPLSALDGETGETIHTFEDTKPTEEVIVSDGTLFLLVSDALVDQQEHRYQISHVWRAGGEAKKKFAWDERKRAIIAIDEKTGSLLWKKEYPVVPLSMASDENRVYFYNGYNIISLDRKDGKEKWSCKPIDVRIDELGTAFAPTLVLYQKVVLFSSGKKTLTAVNSENGDIMWTSEHPESGHHSPEDVLCIDGLVWSGDVARPNRNTGIFTGRNPITGKVESEFPRDVEIDWFHHRCYRSKATDRFILPSVTGIEFVDFKSKHWITHHWVRGACLYGIIPSNGMIYVPPHPCACFIEAKLNGFSALAPAYIKTKGDQHLEHTLSAENERLEKGPAYNRVNGNFSTVDLNSWPTYRHDAQRSGYTKSTVPTSLEKIWEQNLGGKLTQPVIADGKLIVASINTHTVFALDAGSGKVLWTYKAGGRVDSPPTIYQDHVLFGSVDGWVYCIRLSDGDLVWRFRAAPRERMMVSYGQLESVWPVHGSILVHNNILYCVAGRSMFLDGGLRLLLLDPETGQKLTETILDDRDPKSGENLQSWVRGLTMPVALTDILSSDGRYVYMRSQKIGLDGSREIEGRRSPMEQGGEGVHLFAPAGFLDDTWFHRTLWVFGKTAGSGWGNWMNPARYASSGRILSVADSVVYGFGREPAFLSQSSVIEYQLFSANKQFNPESASRIPPLLKEIRKNQGDWIADWQLTMANPPSNLVSVSYIWRNTNLPLQVRAMVLADNILIIAGPPDIVDEVKGFGRFKESEFQSKLADQQAALDGEKGALLWLVSANDGKKIAEFKLESLPVFDGMSAANHQLYLALVDGRLVCMGDKVQI